MHQFPKEKKLLKSREFRRVLDSGKKFILPEVVVFSEENKLKSSRMGLIVTKKIGNAVVRNRIKRRLREVFRQAEHHSDETKLDLDLVFIARAKAKTCTYEKLSSSFEFALKHLIRRHKASKDKRL